MKRVEVETTTLIVLEVGANWPSWLAEAEQDDSVVEVQPADEQIGDFATRVVQRVRSLAERGAGVHSALVMTNDQTDSEVIAARYQMCRALLRTMSEHGLGELILGADPGVGDDAQHQLFALAGALCDELYGTDLGVRVRFSHRRATSGTMPSVPPIAADSDDGSQAAG